MSDQPVNQQKKCEDARKLRNEELIQRMQRKEALWSYDSQASWFPPRPIIKKDAELVRELYGESPAEESQSEKLSAPPAKDKGAVIDLSKRRQKAKKSAL